MHNLPVDSATVRKQADLAPGWDLHAFLLADLYHGFTGQMHPNRPQPKTPGKASRYAKLRARLEAQKNRLRPPTPE